MTEQDRSLGLLTQLARGLLVSGRRNTEHNLGDRRAYVGLSDVGRALTCLRAAVANKLGLSTKVHESDLVRWFQSGEAEPIISVLQRQLILQRGHWLEAGLEEALRANGSDLITQLEIIDADADVPLKAHLDFTLVKGGSRPAVRILELKSTGHLPQSLHPGYEAQLYGQIGLLADLWRQPVFRIGKAKPQSFPNLCRRLFDIHLPDDPGLVDIEGWVLCLSMSEANPFGPYQPNQAMLSLCRRTAERLWTSAQAVASEAMALDALPFCQGFHPLCDWCDHAEACPKFQADPVSDPALEEQLADLSRLKADKTSIETDIGELEEHIRQFYRHAGSSRDWLSTAHFRFRTTHIAGRKTIETARLRAELINRLGETEVEALLADVTSTGNGYERLTVSPVKAKSA